MKRLLGPQPIVLAVAGLDPCSGAGLTADLRTIDRLGLYGVGVVAAITAQNTQEVKEVFPLPASEVAAQLAALLVDIQPAAIKIGMLATGENVAALVAALTGIDAPVVLDPVLASTSGASLAGQDLVEALRSQLMPRCRLATPNLGEAAALSGKAIENLNDAREAARCLFDLGLPAVCITGGHWSGAPVDLFFDGSSFTTLEGKRLGGGELHGTGCLFSSATAVGLAQGKSEIEALSQAKVLTERAILAAVSPGEGLDIPWINPSA